MAAAPHPRRRSALEGHTKVELQRVGAAAFNTRRCSASRRYRSQTAESAHNSCRSCYRECAHFLSRWTSEPSETCVTPRLHTAERGRSMSVDTPERRWTRMQLHTKCASNCRAHPCASCRVPQAETCRGDYSSLLNAAAPVFKSHRFDSSGSALQRNLL